MTISWQTLDNLATDYGDAFYLLNLQKFEANYRNFLAAFQTVYPHSQIAYSYKTNYTPRLCELVQKWGGYAEVVSGMEYRLALRLGVPAGRIILNGPYKPIMDFETALLNGSIVNLDSAYEIPMLQTLAKRFPENILKIGIRCNFDVSTPQRSRFGFDVARDDFLTLVATLRSIPNCQVVGLHCHYLAPERSSENYALIAQRMVNLALTEFGDQALDFIDLGGGFFSHMSIDLQKQFPLAIPTFADYGKAIADVFVKAFPTTGPELILEPGLALVADAMQFVAKVIDIKHIVERQIALVAGSQYDIKPTLSSRNLPISVIPAPSGAAVTGAFDLVGTTCMEGDCLYRGYQGELKVGDYVIFDNVGAYTNVLRPPFINPAAAILALNTTGSPEVIRRHETDEDVFTSYTFTAIAT